jgi:predicted RNA-binding Zn ribbon-like protein
MSRADWSEDHFIAGDVALDFANTVYRRTPELGSDLLEGPDTVGSWLSRAGLLAPPPGGQAEGGEDALGEARVLREHFWAVFEAQKDGRDLPADALVGLFDMARRGLGGEVSVASDGVVTARTVRGALAALALCGLRLVLSPPPRPVRTCDRCGWFFIDRSRGPRRRWCIMRLCGNQAKAARYRSAHP